MKELSKEARELIARERLGEAPAAADVDRVWAGVVRGIEAPPPGVVSVKAASGLGLKLIVGGVAVLAVATSAWIASRGERAVAPANAVVEERAASAVASARGEERAAGIASAGEERAAASAGNEERAAAVAGAGGEERAAGVASARGEERAAGIASAVVEEGAVAPQVERRGAVPSAVDASSARAKKRAVIAPASRAEERVAEIPDSRGQGTSREEAGSRGQGTSREEAGSRRQGTSREEAGSRSEKAPDDPLEAELRAVEAARGALFAKEPARALAILDAQVIRVLAEEADAARIQAIADLGRREEARARALRFLEAHSTSPHAATVRKSAGLTD